ncbi:MAG: hypothetical protein NT052_02255 [Candidatus Shapirobacteria bacterium]|nr:hypothetical protein [Candidatus Shapirobacteria bacterium]
MIINILLSEKFEPLGTIGEGEGLGPWAQPTNPGNIIADIISKGIGLLTIIAGIWFLFQTIIAGYNYMSAAGDKARIENAGHKLTNSLIGLAIVVAAYAILALIGKFLGVNFLDIGGAITTISK